MREREGGRARGGERDERGGERGGERDDAQAASGIPALEWVMAALGTLLVLGSVGYMLLQSAEQGDAYPVVEITVDSIVSTPAGWVVLFEAANTGRGTAAGLEVVGTLTRPGEQPQESQTTIDYVPARSRRGGGLFFTSDPTAGELVVRPVGFQKP